MTLVNVTGVSIDVTGRPSLLDWKFTSQVRGGTDDSVVTEKIRTVRPVAGIINVQLESGQVIIQHGTHTWTVLVPEHDCTLKSLLDAPIAVPPMTPQEALNLAVETYFENSFEQGVPPRALPWDGDNWPSRPDDAIPTLFIGGSAATDEPDDRKPGDVWLPTSGGGEVTTGLLSEAAPKLGGNLDLNGHTVGSATAADLTALHGRSATGTIVLQGDAAAARAALGVVPVDDPALTDTRTPTDGSVTLSKLDPTLTAALGGLGSTYFAVSAGKVLNADSNTNSATKTNIYAIPHYTNAEESVSLLRGQSASDFTIVQIGGGSVLWNAATQIEMYTASNNTTTLGTKRFQITSAGDAILYGNTYVGDGTGAATQQLLVRAAAGQNRFFGFQSGTSTRWLIGANNATESGSDVGSDLVIRSYTDASVSKATLVTFTRSSGDITLGGRLLTAASTTSNAGLVLPHGTAPTSPTNGALWTTTADTFARLNGTTYSFVKANGSNEVGIGTTSTSGYALTVATPIRMNGTTAIGYEVQTYGATGQNVFIRANGSVGSATGVLSGEGLGTLSFWGHDGSTVSGSAALVVGLASENWGSTAHGTRVDIFTTPNGSTSNRGVATFGNDGRLSLPITGSGAGILMGGDTQLYRSAADEITTPDSLLVNGALISSASTTARAGLRVVHGAAPTSPSDGDVWTTTAGMFVRINGVTKTVTLT